VLIADDSYILIMIHIKCRT